MRFPRGKSQNGFTLIEVLIAAFIVAAFLVPAMEALSSVRRAGTEALFQADREHALEDKFKSVIIFPFETLALAAGDKNTPSSYSDPVSFEPRILVYISHFDGDATGNPVTFFDINNVDQNLLWIKVAYADTNNSLATLVLK